MKDDLKLTRMEDNLIILDLKYISKNGQNQVNVYRSLKNKIVSASIFQTHQKSRIPSPKKCWDPPGPMWLFLKFILAPDMCAKKIPLMMMGGSGEGLACAVFV